MSKRPVTKSRGKAKSYKADGTPKKRWTAAERAAKGHGPRKSGGRPRNERDRNERPRNERGHNERGHNERGHNKHGESRPPRRHERDRRGRGDFQPDRRDRRESQDSFPEESADTMSWSATELGDLDAGAVADDAGFAELGLPKVLVAALDQQGITTPFPIQAATIPDALAGKDVLGRGRTGSGKTLGFGLPLLAGLAAGERTTGGPPGAVVLVPTRELALQVADVLAPLAKAVGLSATLVAGGMAFGPQIKAFARGVDVVVATPGRLIDLMDQGVADLSQVRITVLDEADHMADLGFLAEVTTILDAIPADGQRLLFSATLDRGVDRLVAQYLTDPITHEVDSAKASITTMHHHVLHVLPHDKNATTAAIANRAGRTVVFVRTQRGADRVAEQLRAAGVMAGALHGGLTQGARARILGAFKEGSVPVLVATDVAARGIHVDEVTMVLQVDPPLGSKDYLHRAGRTARAGREGHVATITLPHQRKLMRRLTSQAGVRVEPVQVRPADAVLAELTGARVPDAKPIAEETYQALIAPPRPMRRRGPHKKGWGRDAWDKERGGRGGRAGRGGRHQHRRGPRG